MNKTHYAQVDKANESNNNDYWSDTLCGLEETESPVSDNIKEVTCKKCLGNYPGYIKSLANEIQNQV